MADRIRGKVENILYYHRTKIVAGTAAAVLLIWGCWLYGTGNADTVLYGEAVNVTLSAETVERACRLGTQELGKDPEEAQIILGTGIEIDVENPAGNAAGDLEKMTAAIFAHEIDFMICTPETMAYYAKKDALVQIDGSYGIDITNTKLADGDTVFCIFKNSEHRDRALTFAMSLFRESSGE